MLTNKSAVGLSPRANSRPLSSAAVRLMSSRFVVESLAIKRQAVTPPFPPDAQVKETCDPASCHHTAIWHHAIAFKFRRTGCEARQSGIVPSRLASTPHAGPRSGVKPSCAYAFFYLPTHRSRSLAIRHHAITRFLSGAQVAVIDGPAFSHRASP